MRCLARRLGVALGWLLGGVVLIAALLVGQMEWQAFSAARDGAARLAAQKARPAPMVDPRAAPVVILLHGAGLNGRMWDAVRRHLDPGMRVVALDLPGHGADRGGPAYSLDGARAAVLAAAHAAAPAPVVLVGDSLGGYSAMAAAGALPPEQLRGLVLCGSSGHIGAGGAAAMLAQSALVRALLLVGDDDELAVRALERFGVAAADRPAMLAAGINLRAVAPAGRALAGVDFRALLAAADVPVLVVNGEHDQNAVAQEDAFVAGLRHASRLRIDSGHGVSMLRPAEFAAAINAFVARLGANPA